MKYININNLLLITLLVTGIYFVFYGGYGSDEDTLALIGAYESMLSGGELMASRFTPYPVAELGIGFLSYQFGSWAANLFTFVFIFLSLIFFYFATDLETNNKKITLFLLLILSNPVMFFDNLEPIDYSWALLPLCIGMFCMKKKYYDLAIIFFGISIGTRIYFLLFLIPIIFLYANIDKFTIKRKLILFIGSFFIGGLFYLPFWFENGFGLDWLTAATPYNQGILGILSRFFYKIVMSFSFITFILLIIIFLLNLKYLKKYKYSKMLLGIIFTNLIIFLFIPAELSYLQPLLLVIYFLILINLKKQFIYFIIFLNFLSWFIELKPLSIKYKSEDLCNNVEAIGAILDPKFTKGRLIEYINTREKIKCWIKDPVRGEKILQGKALK